jgi:diguanylate cyclase (GGDEF)-like protein/PAS domain S-box-containing protein
MRLRGRLSIAPRVAAVALLALLAAAMPALGGERAYVFQRVTTAEDLSQNTVHAVLQDRTGLVWIGTEGGLHRYDGYAFLTFEHSPEDAGSLPDSLVSALAEDDRGRLWVGGGGGAVAWFDAEAGRFVEVPTPSGPRGGVGALLADADGAVWVGSARGVERIAADGTQADVLVYPRDAGAPAATAALARDGDGRVWVAGSRGLYRIDAGGRRADRIAAAQLRGADAVAVDRDRRVWVGNDQGLWRIGADDSASRAWAAPEAGHPVRSIAQAADGRLWLATYGRGVVAFDPATGEAEVLRRNPALPGGLPEDWLRVLMVDRSGLLWLGGDVLGVSRVDPAGAKFRFLYDDAQGAASFETNKIRSLLQDEAGALWVGTEGDGLKRYDFAARRFDHHGEALRAALPEAVAGADLRVFALATDGIGGLWVGTNRGLLRYAPATRRAQLVATDPAGRNGPQGETIRALLRARDGSLWIGSMEAGLARLSADGATWTRWRSAPADAATLWHDSVMVLHEDRGGRVWAGTLDGLNLIDPASGAVRRLPRAGAARDTPAGDLVRTIHESADGGLWFGGHDGLSRLDELGPGGARFTRWLASDGLPASTVYGILEDGRGDLWLSTNRGVVRFDRGADRFQAYSLEDGLQGLEFNGNVQATLADGRLAFGGPHGINLFYPERLAGSDYAPRVAITAWQAGAERRPVLAPERFTALSIDHEQRIVAFSVAALDYAAPSRNRFEYRLDGFDDRWYALGTRNVITFTNLDAGDYVLRVRGSNRDGVISPEEAVLRLGVRPAWWMSLPMQLLYAAMALALVGLPVWTWRQRATREREHAREVQEREERLRVAIWGSGDQFWDYDLRNNVMVRIGADNLLGFEPEHRISADHWRNHAVHPDDRARVERILDEHVAGLRDSFESEHRVRSASGEYVWVRSRGRIVERDAQGHALRVAGTARDVTRTRVAERERRIAEQVIRSMAEAVTVTDLDFRFVSVNPAFTRITGYTEAEVEGEDGAMLNCQQHSEEFHHALRRAAMQSGRWSGELWQRRKDGEEFLCWLELTEVLDDAGERTHWVGVLTDITDRKRAEQELRYLANYDTLTGLPNRTLLGERLAHAMIRARRHGSKVAVLFLDLDRFKHVNDSMGHAAGDRLLKAAAARIQSTVRDSDTVARLGGDEFTVVIEDLADAQQAERVAVKLLEAFVAPLDIDGRTEVVISPSIGISIYPDHGQVPTDLLKYADTAMYQAKEKGRNTFQTYTEAMDAQARMRASMIAHLHKAVERGELSLVYQPKMSLVDGRITGVEALLRWRNPELGQVSPVTFIPIAEETGLIVPIGEWVIREACVQVQRWMKAGLNATTMAVNVSMLQLLRGELYTKLRQMLEDFRVPAHRFELELTESMVMANAEQSISTLTQIKSLGVNLAIDDFGTGYSSLAYLKRLPIDTLKIDKEFVGDITTDPDDEAITATIITMAHSLGLDVVAEGVESQEQLDYLREQRCDEVQGNFVSLPIDGDRLFKFMLDRKAAAENKGEVREFPLRRG